MSFVGPRLLIMTDLGEARLTAAALLVLGLILTGFGLWMLVVEDRLVGLVPIVFAVFNIGVGFFRLARAR